jgi:hypothetical protein
VKKVLMILISLAFIAGLTSLCFMEDVKAMTREEIATKGGNDVGIAVGEAKYLAQATSRLIRLTGPSSQKLTLPPPCTVIGIKGNNVILKDFYGKVETVEVENTKYLRVGDKVVVKEGWMKVGISLE